METPDRLHQMIVTHAVRLAETAVPLDDAAVMRAAFHEGHDTSSRIMARAWQLGRRLRYVPALARLRTMLPLAGGALLLIVVIGGLSVAGSVTSDRHINIMLAMIALLGANLVTLTLWFLGALLLLKQKSTGGWSLGSMVLAIAGRLARSRGSTEMVHATIDVLQRARLTPWAFGVISHALWTLTFLVALGAMGLAFSFRAYVIGWETTILPPGFFASFVRIVGAIPHWFGFPLPEVTTAANATVSVDQRSWAWWLMGMVTVYGLVPRALLTFACWLLWRRGRVRLLPDLREPYYARLAERFQEIQAHVAGDTLTLNSPKDQATQRTAFAALGFEFHPDQLRTEIAFGDLQPDITHIAGTLEERRAILERLAHTRPARLLVAVDAYATPDRGTERFLREAYSYAALGALLIACSGPRDTDCDTRWRTWLADSTLSTVACIADADEASAWLHESHV